MVEVREVKTKKEQREFLNFPLVMYKDCPYFVPPLYMDEKKIFRDDYVYYDTCKAVYYNAYKDGKMVGRISAFIQKASNEKWNQKRVRFTRFDSINDKEVAHALFDKTVEFAKANNMEEIVGPLGFSDLEREGLLIEGFDQENTFEEQYNYPYYQELIESYGFVKDVDWLESKIYKADVKTDRLEKYSDLILKRFDLHFVEAKNTKQFIKQYGDEIFEVLDETYKNIYGTVPFTDGMKKMTLANFKLILKVDYIFAIADKNEKIVCFGFGMPSLSKALYKSRGRITIPAVFRLVKALHKPEVFDLALVGVIPEYLKTGVAAAIFRKLEIALDDPNILYCETNLNLEYNHDILNMWKNFKQVQNKRRRCFILNVNNK